DPGNNASYLTGGGNLGTTNGETLSIGSSSTGNIILDSTSLLGLNTTKNAPITTGAGLSPLGGNLTVNGTTETIGNGSPATFQTTGNSNLTLSAGTGILNL